MNRRLVLLATLLLNLFVIGIAGAAERAIVPVAGSTAGANGSNFRTEMQLHNPGTSVMRGTIVFMPQAAAAKVVPQSTLEYEIGAKKTLLYADVIASLGASGLGSLDVVPAEGALPRIVVRAFDDQGNFGTRGLVVPAVKESDVPVLGYRFVLLAPASVETYRFNIGVRTLGASVATLRVTEHDATGANVGDPFDLTYAGETFRQQPAAELLGRAIVSGHSYSFETLAGSAIVYATTVDNKSNDGALQLDRPVNRPPVLGDLTVSTGKDEAKTVTLDASDPDGDPITFKVLTAPSHGTLSGITVGESVAPNESASLIYTPASGYQGPDSFVIGVEDDINGRDSATVQVAVGIDTGEPPTAVADFYGVLSGETLTVAAPGVMSNDSDPEGAALVAQLVTEPLFKGAFSFHADGSFSYTPPGSFTGSDSFTYQVSDGGNLSNAAKVTIYVGSPNAPPATVPDAASTDEDTPIVINVLANDSDPDGDTLSVAAVNTTETLGAVTIGGGGTVNYDPTGSAVLQALAAGGSATDTFSYTVQDTNGGTATGLVTVTVSGIDDTPVAVADAATLLEDAAATAVNVLANDTDVDGGAITIGAVTQGTNGTVVITGGGTGLTYQPNANFCGSDSFTYTINGGSTATVTVTVTCVNDVPSFTAGAGPTVLEDSGAYSGSIASAISAGPNEGTQTLTFNVTGNTNPTLFSAGPAVDAAGNLTFTPAANANGTADITVTLSDNGGTANGGVDTSAGQMFTITVTAVNDVPSFTKGADQTVNEGVGAQTVNGWATAISKGPADESGQTLTFNVTGNTNPTMFLVAPAIDAAGNLTYTLDADASGTAAITITLSDDGGTANGGVDTSAAQSFNINVTDVNDAPSFTPAAGPMVLEDSGAYDAAWATAISRGPSPFEDGQTLTFNVTNNTNPSLFSVAPAIDPTTGNLSFTPAANANGTADITVTLSDNGGVLNGGVDTSAPQIFTITVTAVNDAPSFTKGADQTVNEGVGPQTVNGWATALSTGPADESGQTLSFNVTGNTNAAMFSAGPAIDASGNLTYTLVADASGAATITITLQDNGGTANAGVDTSAAQTFDINVTDINDAPSFTTGGPVTVNEDSGAYNAAWATAISKGPSPFEDGQTLTFNVTNNTNPSLFSVAPAISAAGVLTFTPTANVFGSADITVTLQDNGGTASGGVDTSAPVTFTINVTSQNDPPTANDDSASVDEDSGATAIGVLGNDSILPDASETLTIIAVTQPAGGTVVITGGGTGLTFQPNANFAGGTSFTYTINDGTPASDATATVTMTVNAVNDAPANTVPGVQTVDQLSTLTFPGNISIADIDAFTPQVTLGVDSGTLTLSGTTGLTITSGANGSATMTFNGTIAAINTALNGLVYDPVDTFNAAATLTITTNDLGQTGLGGALQALDTVTINVTALNDPPVNSLPGAQSVNEDATLILSTGTTNVISISDPDAGSSPVQVTLTATNGTMTLAGITGLSFTTGSGTADATMTFTGTIAAINTALDGLQFIPTANFNGAASIQIVTDDQGNTGSGGAQSDTDPLAITVNQVNDAPAGTSGAVSGAEDTQYTFTATDFGFTDPTDSPANALQSVVVTTLPGLGSLTLSGSGFAAGTEITVTDINAGNLKFQGAANGSGSPYTTFTFQVRDDGGTANSGVDLDPTPNTMTINLSSVNDAPAGSDNAVTGDEDVPYTFAAANFGFSDPNDSPANSLQSVVITTLPAAGVLQLSGAGFAAGTEISLANIPNLTFTGAANAFGSPYTTFTFQVRDNGGTANGGVDLDATPNTITVNLNPVNDAPIVKSENGLAGQDPAWQTIGNTELRVDMVAGTTPNVSDSTPDVHPTYEGLIDNDSDVEGDPIGITAVVGCGDATAPFDCTLASGAVIHVDANGEFSFTPGPADTTDTFTYTVTDTPALGSPASTNGIVVINMSEMVWYVDPAAAAGGNGTSMSPYDTLDSLDGVGGAGDSDSFGDYIFVHDGSLSRSTPMEMEANQHLVGEGFGLSIPVNLNGNGSPWVGVAAGTAPQISATTGDTITVNTAIPVEIVGLSLASTAGNSIDLTVAAALSGSAALTIGSNEFRADGAEGIDVNLNAGTTGTVALAITNNSWNTSGTHTGNAIDVNRAAGTVNLNISNNTNILSTGAGGLNVVGGAAANTFITGFANNTVHQNTVGTGISISNATFDATPTGAYQQVSGGTTVVGVSGDGVGTSGVVLTSVAGDLAFTDLDIFASNGSGLVVSGTGVVNVGAGTGTRVTVGASVGIIEATNGPAVSLSSMTTDLQLTSLKSTNSTTTGVSLTNVGDGTTNSTVSAGSGSTITNASGTDFVIDGGNATVTYNGTITDTSGRLVNVTNTTGDTKSFTGAISDSGGPSTGVSLTSNTGATITFNGGLVLSTGANAAFTATGGGTVSVCDEAGCNAGATGGLVNTLTTTTGTALNVANTTIGSGSLEFKSISANGGANGIFLQNTGSTGGLKVKGDGTNFTKGGNASGGTIQNMAGADGATAGNGIYLENTQKVSLQRMQLNGFQNSAIRGFSVTDFTLQYSTISGVSGNASGPTEGAVTFGDIIPAGTGLAGGTNLIDNCKISGAVEHNIEFYSYENTSSYSLTVSNSDVKSNSAALGSDGIQIETGGAFVGTATISIQSCAFDDNKSQPLQAAANGSSTIDITINNCTVQRTTQGNEGFVLSNGTNGDLIAHVTNNTITGIGGAAIFVGQTAGNATASSSLTAVIQGNTITHPATATNSAIIAFLTSTVGQVSQANILISGNVVTQNSTGGVSRGIFIDTPDTSTTPSFTATVLNNSVAVGDNVAGVNGIAAQSRRGSGCFDIRGNVVTFPNGNPGGVAGVRLRQVAPGTANLEQGAALISDTPAVVLQTNNSASGTTTEVLGTATVVSNAGCANPPV